MQTIKRAAAILLVLALALSWFQMVPTANAAELAETVPVSTDTAVIPTDVSGDPPASTTAPPGDTPTEAAEEPEPPASPETTAPTEVPVETTEATEPVTETTEPVETTEATTPVEPTEPSTQPEMVNTLTAYLASKAASISINLFQEVEKSTVLSVTDADPDGSTMQTIMEKLDIGAVLDYCVFDMVVVDGSVSGTVEITFRTPSIMANDSGSVYAAEIRPDGTLNLIGSVNAVVNTSKNVERIRFPVVGFSGRSTFVILTSDWPSETAFQTYPEYTVRATYGAISGIGDSDGGLTYHCWSASSTPSASKPAICLNSNRLFRSGDNTWSYGLGNSTYTASDGPTSSWSSLSQSKRELLVLLCCYGLSDWSPSSRYIDDINSGNTFAAMQLVAWEWINGVSDGTYTSRYNSTVQDIAGQLRSLCYSNPDNIDTTKSYVYVVWPNSQTIYNGNYVWGQTLIALHTVEYAKSTGNLTVTKAVTGTGSKANWRMELYTSQSSANSATGYVASAYTDANGLATFGDLDAATYYVREAPASRQDKVSTTGWTLSTTVLSKTVTAGNTVSAGTITNISPGILSVTKTVSPSSMATAANLQNWRFELYTTQAAAIAGGTNYVAYAYTNTSGVATFSNLTPNITYYGREAPASRQDKVTTTGWSLSTTVLSKAATGGATAATSMGTITNTYGKHIQCNTEWSFTFTVTGSETNPTITAECANTLHPATINLQKLDTSGKPLPGSKFALEWSEDGTSWKPVVKSDDMTMGGCSSPELDENGCLTIAEDGTASFTGLYPVVYYRITEVETPNGYQLLKDSILVDKLLPEDDFEISYRVVNNDVFTLPKTGSSGFWMILPSFGLASVALLLNMVP